MNVLSRNKRIIKHCSKYIDNGIKKFNPPVERNINFEPTNSSEQVMAYGQYYPLYLKAIVRNELGKEFKAGDRCYIYVEAPEEHDVLCNGADYKIDKEPIATINFTEISFKRLSSDMSDV